TQHHPYSAFVARFGRYASCLFLPCTGTKASIANVFYHRIGPSIHPALTNESCRDKPVHRLVLKQAFSLHGCWTISSRLNIYERGVVPMSKIFVISKKQLRMAAVLAVLIALTVGYLRWNQSEAATVMSGEDRIFHLVTGEFKSVDKNGK